MINFFITGVWKDTQNRITHVLLHERRNNSIISGIKTSESEVISLINIGKVVHTLTWNYHKLCWYKGAKVLVENNLGRFFLKTSPNNSTIDNLDNSISMNIIHK